MGFLDDDGFVDGLMVSAVILGPLLIGLLVLRRWRGVLAPVGGVAAVGVALLALAGADALPGHTIGARRERGDVDGLMLRPRP